MNLVVKSPTAQAGVTWREFREIRSRRAGVGQKVNLKRLPLPIEGLQGALHQFLVPFAQRSDLERQACQLRLP